MKRLLPTLVSMASLFSVHAAPADVATGINSLGLDLHRRLATAGGGNGVTSPWSITSALTMTWGGAAGVTKAEMGRVLHLTGEEATVHAGFAALAADLALLAQTSQGRIEAAKKFGGPATPLVIQTANRLFGDRHYPFEKPFLALTEKFYGAPLETIDFRQNPEAARTHINDWVARQTKDRIRDLIPGGAIDRRTRLVLTNAIFFKAAWAKQFQEEPEAPFLIKGSRPVKVAGLTRQDRFGHLALPGGAAVTIPYAGGGLHFVLLVPDAPEGLAAMEKNLTPEILTKIAGAEPRDIILHFPQFKLEPGRVMLAENLIAMGMPKAFDQPKRSADFSGIAPRQPDDYLFISKVIHQAFIAVDKHGTEASAATAVAMMRPTSMAPREKAPPLEIRVDRPFAFAIQHQASGACLFLGRVTDPR